jgi:low affinity Fe/Cu permease
MHKPFAAVTKWITEVLASPWALGVALALVAFYLVVGPQLGFPAQKLDLAFFITLTTFVLVFVIEHQGYVERAAMQVKLDEIIAALDADRSKIGIEDKPPKEIDHIRDETRQREGQRKVG